MKKSAPLYVLFGDTHAGSSISVSLPKVALEAGGAKEASQLQLDLLGFWGDFWGKIKALGRSRPLHIYHMGDAIDGTIKNTTQSLPATIDQEELAFKMLLPVRKMATKFYMLKGTEAHVGQQAQSEVRIARNLKADGIAYHIQVWQDKRILFDLSHHGKVGGLPWTSAAAQVAARVEFEYLKHKMPVPRFVVRAHTHQIDDSGERNPDVRAFTTPAWQCRTSHGHKVASYSVADIGGVVVDGEEVTFYRYGFESLGKYEDTLVIKD